MDSTEKHTNAQGILAIGFEQRRILIKFEKIEG
jgi:hypothetical protein